MDTWIPLRKEEATAKVSCLGKLPKLLECRCEQSADKCWRAGGGGGVCREGTGILCDLRSLKASLLYRNLHHLQNTYMT